MRALRTTALVFLTVAATAASTACSSSSSPIVSSDAGADSGDNDGGADGGVTPVSLGFTASNVGAAFAGIDASKLKDMDYTGAGNQLGGENDGCPADGCKYVLITQSNNVKVGVYIAKSWRLEPNATLNITQTFPVIIVALDTITILGHVQAGGSGTSSTPGGYVYQNPPLPGGGPGGGGPGTGSAPGPGGGGGGGGGYCGAGGIGGNASSPPGAAGVSYGNATIIPLVGGSAGGGGDGGTGGGAVQFVAGTSIDVGVGGWISAGGGLGGYGGIAAQPPSGAGSGGAILLESPSVSIEGIVAANGGGGGGDESGDAQDGAPNATPAPGGPAAVPTQGTAAGGVGSAGTTVAGATGGVGNAMQNGGGGGGGAGYIRINTKTGAATVSGTVSPDLTSTCGTQGKVSP